MKGRKFKTKATAATSSASPSPPQVGSPNNSVRLTYRSHAVMDMDNKHHHSEMHVEPIPTHDPTQSDVKELQEAAKVAGGMFSMRDKIRMMDLFPVDRTTSEVDTDRYIEMLRGMTEAERREQQQQHQHRSAHKLETPPDPIALPPIHQTARMHPHPPRPTQPPVMASDYHSEEHITLESRDGARMTYSRSQRRRTKKEPSENVDKLLADRTAALTAIFQLKLRQQQQHFVRLLEAARSAGVEGGFGTDGALLLPEPQHTTSATSESVIPTQAEVDLREQVALLQQQLQEAQQHVLKVQRQHRKMSVKMDKERERLVEEQQEANMLAKLANSKMRRKSSVVTAAAMLSSPTASKAPLEPISTSHVGTQTVHVDPQGSSEIGIQTNVSTTLVAHHETSPDDCLNPDNNFPAGVLPRACASVPAEQPVLLEPTPPTPQPGIVNREQQTSPTLLEEHIAELAPIPKQKLGNRMTLSISTGTVGGSGSPNGSKLGTPRTADLDVMSVASDGRKSERKWKPPVSPGPGLQRSPRSGSLASMHLERRQQAPPTGMVGFLAITGLEAAQRTTGAQALSTVLSSASASMDSAYRGSIRTIGGVLADKDEKPNMQVLFFDGDMCLVAFPTAPLVALQVAIDNLTPNLAFSFEVFKCENSFVFAQFPCYESKYSRAMRNLSSFAGKGEIIVPSLTYKRYVIPLAEELVVKKMEVTLHSSLLEDDLYSIHKEAADPLRIKGSSKRKAMKAGVQVKSSKMDPVLTDLVDDSSSTIAAAGSMKASKKAPKSRSASSGLNSRFEFFPAPETGLVSYMWSEPAVEYDRLVTLDRRHVGSVNTMQFGEESVGTEAGEISSYQRILIVNAKENVSEAPTGSFQRIPPVAESISEEHNATPLEHNRLVYDMLKDDLEQRRFLCQQGVQAQPNVDEIGCGPAEDLKMTSHITQTPVVHSRNRAVGTSELPGKIDEEDIEEVMEAFNAEFEEVTGDDPTAPKSAENPAVVGGGRVIRIHNKAADLCRCNACKVIPVKNPPPPSATLAAGTGLSVANGKAPSVYIMIPCGHIFCWECVANALKSVSRDETGYEEVTYTCPVCHQVSLEEPVACPALEILLLEKYGKRQRAIELEEEKPVTTSPSL